MTLKQVEMLVLASRVLVPSELLLVLPILSLSAAARAELVARVEEVRA